MVSEASVREKLSELSRNQLSFEEFENWLVSAAWNMHRDSSPEAVDLVSSIHLLLSERDDHVLNEPDLRDQLRALLNDAVADAHPIYYGEPVLAIPVLAARRPVARLVYAQARL